MKNQPKSKLSAKLPTNFLPKLAAFAAVTAFGILFACNRELEWFFRIPLTVFCAGGTVAMAMSLEECRYRYALTEEGIGIFLHRKMIALAPWEKIHWRLAENIAAPQEHLRDLNEKEKSCFLSFRFEGMEPPRYLMRSSEEYRMGRVDFYTVQAFLLCCPNAPDYDKNVPQELLQVDAARLAQTPLITSQSHRFAAAIYQKKHAWFTHLEQKQ